VTPPNGISAARPGPCTGTLAAPDETTVPEPNLAVVIPTKNNELVIGSLVLLARRYAARVIVADDGSTDRTVEVAREAGAEVVTPPSASRAGAILAGCRHAVGTGARAVVLLDPRENHFTREIPILAASVLAGQADLTIGSRTLTARKALYSAAATDAPPADIPFQPTDPGSTFRVLGPRALTMIDVLPDDEDFETAMTRLATRRGLAVTEQPVTLRNAAATRSADDLPLYRGKRVAVVVPAHNEELLIGETLSGIPDFVARIYVVNDCSADRTAELVDHYAGQDPSVVPIHHETNQGVGAAIVTGYRRALEDGVDVVAVMAGDNQMDPAFLPHLLDPIVDGKCDYTMGNRLASLEFRKQMSRWRFFGNSLLTLLTKIASGYWQMVDPQNGYTAISARALEQLDLSDIYPRYGYCNDLLVKLNIWGFRVVNVPHPARYGLEKSGIMYSTYIVKLSRLLLTDFLQRLKSKYIVMSFHPLVFYYFLGVVLVGLGLLGGLYSLYWRFIENNPIFVPVVVSLIVFVLGTQFWLFAMLFDMQQEREDSGWY
jgi:glycosyltransferase involved in cell wall biosynthesis